MQAQPKQSLMIGSIFIVLAFLANTIQSVFGKAIENQVSVEMFSWVTFSSALIVVTIIMAFRRFRDLKTNVLPLHLLRGGTGISGFLLFISAAQKTSLMNANVLLNTTPIFIPLLAMAFLHNRIVRQFGMFGPIPPRGTNGIGGTHRLGQMACDGRGLRRNVQRL